MTPAVARAPDAFDRLGAAIADRVNPIVVKEVRQGLRTRTFWVFFTLLLVFCLMASLVAVTVAAESRDVGQGTFAAFYVCLALVQFFVIPYSAYRSMAREREEETWVLLTLTGLSSRRILAGKMGSFMMQGLLYASAAAPFLIFSYYLNGIDLPSILLTVLVGAAYQVFLTSVSVSTATLAESRLARGLLHFVVLAALAQGLVVGISSLFGTIALVGRGVSSDFWLGAGALLFAMLSSAGLLFEAAAARLSLVTEAYARGPRLAFLVQLVGGVAFFLGTWSVTHERVLLVVGSVVASLYLASVGLFIASDRDGMAPNHWVTGRRSLLKPGALRGYALVLLCALAVLVSFGGAAFSDASLDADEVSLVLAAPLFALLYLSMAMVVGRWIPHPPWQSPVITRLTFLALVVAGTAFPPLLGEAVDRAGNPLINVLNPVVCLVNLKAAFKEDSPSVVLLVGALACGAALWALLSLRRRDVRPG